MRCRRVPFVLSRMKTPADLGLVKRLNAFASAASLFSLAVGVSALAGWTFHVSFLTTWGIAPIKMVTNTAVCFVLLGTALWLQRNSEGRSGGWAGRFAANSAATVAGLVGLLSLIEHLFGSDFHIDQLLVHVSLTDYPAGARPGLMSALTAADFLILGIALLLLDWKTRRGDWPAQFLCLGAAIPASFGLLALVLSPSAPPTGMAWPTAVTFFALSSGLICSRANWALGRLLTSQSPGARLLRTATPAALLVLSLIGWFLSKPLLRDSHFTWVEMSVLALFSSLTLVGFIAWMAFVVERSDLQRQRAEAALNIGPEQLDRFMDRIEAPESETRLLRKVNWAFAVALLLMGALGLLSWRNAQRAAADADWVAHTHRVSTALELTLRHLLDVESGGRGYALTGEEKFLEPYETGKVEVGEDLQALRILILDQDQKPLLDVLAGQAAAKIKATEEVTAMRRNSRKGPGDPELQRGKQIMDAARLTLAQMEAREKTLLEQRIQRARATERLTAAVIALGSVLGVIFLSVAGIIVSREISISTRARAQVGALNADLERRVAERTAALGESEGRLAGMIQTAMDAILTVDEQQNLVMFNGAAERMFRCPAAEALGQPVTRFIPQRYHAEHGGYIKKFGENGATARAMGALGKLWAVRADGAEFQIEASISHIEAGGKTLFTVILRDITERVKAEEIREHLAAVVDSSDDAIISKDLNGIINAWNRGAENVFGYSAAEAMGRPMLMLFPPDRVKEESDILARIRRGESVEHFETVRVRKDGESIDVSVTISPIRGRDGIVVGASKIARDITQRKLAEEALQESEERFRTLIEQASDAFYLHDSEGRFLEVNRQACESLGYTREELLGMCVSDVEQDLDLRTARQAWEQAEPGKAYTLQGRQRRKDGTALPVEVRLSTYYMGGKKLHLGLARDVTERKLAEEALRRSDAGRVVALEAANLGEWEIDLSTQKSRRSRRHDQIFGYASQMEWSPEIFFQHVHPDDRVRARTNLELAVSQGTKLDTECRIILPDGEVRWIRACGDLYRDSAGNSTRMFGTVEDITGRKNIAEALRSSEEQLRLAVDGAQLGTWHWNLESRELVWSPGCLALFGLPLDTKMTYEIFLGALHPDDRAPADQAVRRSLDEHSGYGVEYRALWPDGTLHWIAARGQGYYDAAGKAVRMEGVAMDVTERRDAQERLNLSEENYRTLFESMDEGFCTIEVLFDPDNNPVDYRFLEINPAFERQTGIQNARGKSMREIAPRHEEYWFQLYGRVALTGEPVRIENQAAQLRGWYEVHAFRVGEAHGRKVAIIFNDISERKKQETELKESEDRFRLFVEHAPAALAMFDREMRYLRWSRRWQRDYGLEGRDLRGLSHYELFPEIPERWREIHRHALAGEVLRGEDDRLDRIDGSVQWIRWEARPWYDRTDAIAGIVIFAEEITERKHAEERLAGQAEELSRQTEELLRSQQALETQSIMLQSVLDSISEGLVAADETGKFILWNPAATRIVGLGADNIPPERWSDHYGVYLADTKTVFPPEQNPLLRAIHGQACTAEMYVRNKQLESGVWIEASANPLRGKDGIARGGVIAFRDITQRKKDEREIRKLNEELEARVVERTAQLQAANQELEAFTYSVSHDLRAPLRHISGFSKILSEEYGPNLPPEAQHHLQRIQGGTLRMGQLVDDLLNLARVGRRGMHISTSRLRPLVDEVIAELAHECAGRRIELKIGSLPAAACDPTLIRQVFQNLIGNALKYSRPRSPAVIEIGQIKENGRPVIFVRDNGVGFSMKYADKLFGVFQRLHRAEDFEGTGVGLATAQRIVQKHGGRIWAEAELDKGATFYFTLGGSFASSEKDELKTKAAIAGEQA